MFRVKSPFYNNEFENGEHKIGNFTIKDYFIYYKDRKVPIAVTNNNGHLVLFYRYDCHIHREFCRQFDIKPFTYRIINNNYIALTDETENIVNAIMLHSPPKNDPSIYTRNYPLHYGVYLCIDNEFRIYNSYCIEEEGMSPTTYECCIDLYITQHYEYVTRTTETVIYIDKTLNRNIKSELVSLRIYDINSIPQRLDSELLDRYLIMSEAKQLIIYSPDDYCIFSIDPLTREWECSDLINGDWMEYVRDYYYRPNRNTVKKATN